MVDGPPRGADGPALRVPPHNLQAEESLLGAMLLSPQAIAEVVQEVDATDFYKPAHGHVFDAVTTLYGAGQGVDAVTVSEELKRAGLLDAIGGLPALITVVSRTPAITNAAYYARIVNENARLRRLIHTAGEIAELGYSPGDDVQKTIDTAESMIFRLAEQRSVESMDEVRNILDRTMDHLESLYERPDGITGVPTGYNDLDELLAGLQPSALIVVGARPAMGKCVAWDTLLVDPRTGRRRRAADVVADGRAGAEVQVLSLEGGGRLVSTRPSAFIDDGVKPAFRVRTAGGREITTTATHPYLTPQGWRPLAELAVGDRVAVAATLPVSGTVPLPPAHVDLLAHLLGADLSGAHPVVEAPPGPLADDLRTALASLGIHMSPLSLVPAFGHEVELLPPERDSGWLQRFVTEHGLDAPAHQLRIPEAVFELPRRQLARFVRRLLGRLAGIEVESLEVHHTSVGLLADLQHLLLRLSCTATLDRQGSRLVVDERGSLLHLAVEAGFLGRDEELVLLIARFEHPSVGGRAQELTRVAPGTLRLPVLNVEAAIETEASGGGGGVRLAGGVRTLLRPALGSDDADVRWERITEIADVGPQPVVDLTVPELHNFVAADVVVHNTAFALGATSGAAMRSGKPVVYFSLEMSQMEMTQRLLAAEARVDLSRIRTGRLTEADWSKLNGAMNRLGEAPIFIDDNPNVTIMDIRAKARRLKSRVGDLGLITIDYLQLMTGRGSAENRQVEVAEISRGLKILARELECPVMALSQLSRQLEARQDKRPMLSDLRESGSIEQDADVVMFLYRDEEYHKDSPDIGQAEVIVAKHRNGPTDTVRLAFLGQYTRFANMAKGV